MGADGCLMHASGPSMRYTKHLAGTCGRLKHVLSLQSHMALRVRGVILLALSRSPRPGCGHARATAIMMQCKPAAWAGVHPARHRAPPHIAPAVKKRRAYCSASGVRRRPGCSTAACGRCREHHVEHVMAAKPHAADQRWRHRVRAQCRLAPAGRRAVASGALVGPVVALKCDGCQCIKSSRFVDNDRIESGAKRRSEVRHEWGMQPEPGSAKHVQRSILGIHEPSRRTLPHVKGPATPTLCQRRCAWRCTTALSARGAQHTLRFSTRAVQQACSQRDAAPP